MPQVCSICHHDDREGIEAALLESKPYRHIAARYDTSTGALQRHKANCIPITLTQARGAAEVAHGDTLLEKIEGLETDARRLAAKAEKSKDLRCAVLAVKEIARILALVSNIRIAMQQAGMAASAPETIIRVEFIDSVMERAAEIRRGKVRCQQCDGLGWRAPFDERPPLLLEAGQNGVHSLGCEPEGEK